jgi:hypothetical protein
LFQQGRFLFGKPQRYLRQFLNCENSKIKRQSSHSVCCCIFWMFQLDFICTDWKTDHCWYGLQAKQLGVGYRCQMCQGNDCVSANMIIKYMVLGVNKEHHVYDSAVWRRLPVSDSLNEQAVKNKTQQNKSIRI